MEHIFYNRVVNLCISFDGQPSQFLAEIKFPMGEDTKAVAEVENHGCVSHFLSTIGVEVMDVVLYPFGRPVD